MKAALFAALLAGCSCEEETQSAAGPAETPAAQRMLEVRRVVQKLANARSLAGWGRDVDALAKKTGLSKTELRWRVIDLVRLHRTCGAVATADERTCDALTPMSVDAADRCRNEAAYYGIFAGRMVRLDRCGGEDADRVAGLTGKERDFIEHACRSARGDAAACQGDALCKAWGVRAERIPRVEDPTSLDRDEPILAAISRGGRLSCDAVLVRAIDERLGRFVTPPPPL